MNEELREKNPNFNDWIALGDGRPVSWREGGLTVTRTSAWSGPGCHNGCIVLVYTDDAGKLVKVEGDPESPYNQGRLCSRCLALPQVTNHPDRILHPMKRDRADRGKDAWTRITWDEAYAEIVEKFNAIKEKHGAKSVIFAQGTGRDIFPYISRLAWSFGSPNAANLLSGIACYLPRIAASYNTTGAFWVVDCAQNYIDRYDNPEYRVTDVLAVWGCNPLQSNADGFYGHWIIDLMKRGTRLLVIDPRTTWLAAKSELHLQLRCGTDGALALGMLNIIIQEKLYDEEFVDKYCYGFEALAERASEYPVGKVAEICWLKEEDILAAARMFAKGDPSAIQMGVALDMGNAEAIPTILAICNLISITGNLDVPGGMIPSHFVLNTGFGWGKEFLDEEVASELLGLKEYPFFGTGFSFAQPDVTIQAMRTDDPYPIRATWLQTTNPLACTSSQPQQILEGLLRQECVVGVDLFMTPTIMAAADYFLPAATFPERYGIRASDGPQFGATINKIIQVGEAKSDMQINREIGRLFNPEAYPWDNDRDMFTSLIDVSYLSGLSFDELAEQAPIYKNVTYRKHEKGLARRDGQLGFGTATGRIELYSLALQSNGLDPLPYWEEPQMSPVSTPDVYKEYPLILSTGARDFMSFHSEHRQIPALRAHKKWPEVEINPKTAAENGICDGDWIWLENPLGRAQHKARITHAVPEYMVMADHGWWLPEEEGASPNNYGVWRINVNQLIPAGQPGRSGFGANYKSLLCKVYKVKDGE